MSLPSIECDTLLAKLSIMIGTDFPPSADEAVFSFVDRCRVQCPQRRRYVPIDRISPPESLEELCTDRDPDYETQLK